MGIANHHFILAFLISALSCQAAQGWNGFSFYQGWQQHKNSYAIPALISAGCFTMGVLFGWYLKGQRAKKHALKLPAIACTECPEKAQTLSTTTLELEQIKSKLQKLQTKETIRKQNQKSKRLKRQEKEAEEKELKESSEKYTITTKTHETLCEFIKSSTSFLPAVKEITTNGNVICSIPHLEGIPYVMNVLNMSSNKAWEKRKEVVLKERIYALATDPLRISISGANTSDYYSFVAQTASGMIVALSDAFLGKCRVNSVAKYLNIVISPKLSVEDPQGLAVVTEMIHEAIKIYADTSIGYAEFDRGLAIETSLNLDEILRNNRYVQEKVITITKQHQNKNIYTIKRSYY